MSKSSEKNFKKVHVISWNIKRALLLLEKSFRKRKKQAEVLEWELDSNWNQNHFWVFNPLMPRVHPSDK